MGADIHTFMEIGFRYPNNEVEWRLNREAVFKDRYYRKDKPLTIHNAKYTATPYTGRNYELFALLADVRNDDTIEPLDEPRGLPSDISDDLRYEYGDVDNADWHSASWFTLAELEKFLAEGKFDRQPDFEWDYYKHFRKTIKRMREVAVNNYTTPDWVRLVFWFDN